MAITYVEVETQQLKSDTNELLEKKKRAEDTLKELEEEISELNAMWSGKANRAFNRQFYKDVEYMNKLLGKMGKLAECMEFAANEYVRCENEVKAAVESIKV